MRDVDAGTRPSAETVADRRDGGENNDLLVEPAGDGRFLRGARSSAVLAPEIDFIAGVQRGMEKVALGPAGVLETLCKANEVDHWQ